MSQKRQTSGTATAMTTRPERRRRQLNAERGGDHHSGPGPTPQNPTSSLVNDTPLGGLGNAENKESIGQGQLQSEENRRSNLAPLPIIQIPALAEPFQRVESLEDEAEFGFDRIDSSVPDPQETEASGSEPSKEEPHNPAASESRPIVSPPSREVERFSIQATGQIRQRMFGSKAQLELGIEQGDAVSSEPIQQQPIGAAATQPIIEQENQSASSFQSEIERLSMGENANSQTLEQNQTVGSRETNELERDATLTQNVVPQNVVPQSTGLQNAVTQSTAPKTAAPTNTAARTTERTEQTAMAEAGELQDEEKSDPRRLAYDLLFQVLLTVALITIVLLFYGMMTGRLIWKPASPIKPTPGSEVLELEAAERLVERTQSEVENDLTQTPATYIGPLNEIQEDRSHADLIQPASFEGPLNIHAETARIPSRSEEPQFK